MDGDLAIEAASGRSLWEALEKIHAKVRPCWLVGTLLNVFTLLAIAKVKTMKAVTNIEEVIFEERDTQIFSIPDVKTKLSTLQNYFFPRLEILLRHTLDIVAEAYNVNPYEQMTFSYCPSHREKAKENTDYGMAHIGITGKKSKQPLKIFRREGQAFVYHPTFLTYKVLPSGIIYVEL